MSENEDEQIHAMQHDGVDVIDLIEDLKALVEEARPLIEKAMSEYWVEHTSSREDTYESMCPEETAWLARAERLVPRKEEG